MARRTSLGIMHLRARPPIQVRRLACMRRRQALWGSPTVGSSGHFTADATLTAHFAQKNEGIAPNLLNTISGTINNFEDAEGNNLGWSVDLNKTDIDSGDGSIDIGTTTGNGSWTGTFYGNPDVPATDTDNTDNYPTGVAGEFNAHLGDGHVVGAYGATR